MAVSLEHKQRVLAHLERPQGRIPRAAIARRGEPAVGVINPKRPNLTQTVIGFDHETFATVRALAVKNGTSFAEQVRLLVEWGLEAVNA
jgi:hypothetical protein